MEAAAMIRTTLRHISMLHDRQDAFPVVVQSMRFTCGACRESRAQNEVVVGPGPAHIVGVVVFWVHHKVRHRTVAAQGGLQRKLPMMPLKESV
jgi:hypothetical protein